MPNPVIDTKSETHTFKHFPGIKETIVTTISLIEMGAKEFGLSYVADYSGVKNGKLQGGPIKITGNGSFPENKDPKVLMIISNYSDSGTSISLHLAITVDAPVIGTVTLFDQTLGGKYGTVSIKSIVAHMAESTKVKSS